MKIEYLHLKQHKFVISANPVWGDDFWYDIPMLWGIYDDDINWTDYDNNGYKFEKSGNTLTVYKPDDNILVFNTLTSARPIGTFTYSNNFLNIWTNKYNSGFVHTSTSYGKISVYNDPAAVDQFFRDNDNLRSIGGAVVYTGLGKNVKYKVTYKPDPSDYGYTHPELVGVESVWGDGSSARGAEYVADIEHTDVEEDPFMEGGFSVETDWIDGTFNADSDTIGMPELPEITAVSAGFIKLFTPTVSQMNALAGYMWSDAFDLDTYRKIFANPMDCILGLSILPVSVPSGGASEVRVGNISTGISMTTAASQYMTLNCGTISIKPYWGAYLDFSPYTKISLYLPYIGTHDISIDDVMGGTIGVQYNIDVLSGACTAMVLCNGSVKYQYAGHISQSVPISGNDWTNMINGVLRAAGTVATTIATGGMSAPLSAVGNAVNAGANIASNVTSMKPTISKGGGCSGASGMMGVQTPYVVITRPRQCLPENHKKIEGYPSYITQRLGDLSGYTVIEKIHLENIPATEAELNELENILMNGVIL